MPIVWLSKFLEIPIQERVSGSTLFEKLRDNPGKVIRVYFFGGLDGIAEMACRKLDTGSVGLRCSGHYSPGFGTIFDMSTDSIINDINLSNSDFLIVSLGAKKGQAWIQHNKNKLNVPIISHLGAVINFVAGTVKRAPTWMQKSGSEWVWRIVQEPQLWRRYFHDGMSFIRIFLFRAIPLAYFLRAYNPSDHEFGIAHLAIEKNDGLIEISLSGAWGSKNLGALRDCLTDLTSETKDIIFDLTHVSYVDSAFLGVMLLLYGNQIANNKRLHCKNPSSSTAKRLFFFSGCAFLFKNESL
jgi:N-acetylglucosaminyldiphosphoundecaprenol N-acetyl-beta-D-mannosaminyltransferase